jgi:hypothetical protein
VVDLTIEAINLYSEAWCGEGLDAGVFICWSQIVTFSSTRLLLAIASVLVFQASVRCGV